MYIFIIAYQRFTAIASVFNSLINMLYCIHVFILAVGDQNGIVPTTPEPEPTTEVPEPTTEEPEPTSEEPGPTTEEPTPGKTHLCLLITN